MALSYTSIAGAAAVLRSDGAVVPDDPGNSDWLAYQAWLAAGNELAPAAPMTPPAAIISDRQFFQQLALTPSPSNPSATIITQAEALAAVSTGTIPSEMQPLISSLPAAEQFAAQMKIAGATQFDIGDPITQAIAASYGWSEAQLAAFWAAAAAL